MSDKRVIFYWKTLDLEEIEPSRFKTRKAVVIDGRTAMIRSSLFHIWDVGTVPVCTLIIQTVK